MISLIPAFGLVAKQEIASSSRTKVWCGSPRNDKHSVFMSLRAPASSCRKTGAGAWQSQFRPAQFTNSPFRGNDKKDTNVLVTALRRIISLSAPEW